MQRRGAGVGDPGARAPEVILAWVQGLGSMDYFENLGGNNLVVFWEQFGHLRAAFHTTATRLSVLTMQSLFKVHIKYFI